MQATPFEHLAQMQSIMDSSKVEVLGESAGRSISSMKWKISTPQIISEVGDESQDVGHGVSTAMDDDVDAVTITALNTPPHWLLIRAHKQASDTLAAYHKRSVAFAVSHVHCAQKHERLWRKTWDEMIANIRVRNTYA